MSSSSSHAGDPEYFIRYKNLALSRSASGVLTLRIYTDGGPHTFGGTTRHDLPRLLEDIAFDSASRVLVLAGPIIAAVNGLAPVHSEYALLADAVIAGDTTVLSGRPQLAQPIRDSLASN
jgi:hypothetical protein